MLKKTREGLSRATPLPPAYPSAYPPSLAAPPSTPLLPPLHHSRHWRLFVGFYGGLVPADQPQVHDKKARQREHERGGKHKSQKRDQHGAQPRVILAKKGDAGAQQQRRTAAEEKGREEKRRG